MYLSTRRGTWVLHRIGQKGLPSDVFTSRRLKKYLNKLWPQFLLTKAFERSINARLDHDLYGLRANYPPFAQHPLVNDDIGNRLACGTLQIKNDIKRFTETGVEFVDGSFEDNIDVVSNCRFVSGKDTCKFCLMISVSVMFESGNCSGLGHSQHCS